MFGISQYTVEDTGSTAYPGSNTDRMFGAVLFTGPTLHAVIAVYDPGFFIYDLKHIVRTYPCAHLAAIA